MLNLDTDLIMDWGQGRAWPFVEDQNANITGYGHQDQAMFAAAVNHYDRTCNNGVDDTGEDWSADDITHAWVRLEPGGETFRRCESDAPDALAVTTLWGAR